MNTEQELTPEQVVAIALAHDHIASMLNETGAMPGLSKTLAHVRESYGTEAQDVCKAIGASLRTEKALKGAASLLSFILTRRNRAG